VSAPGRDVEQLLDAFEASNDLPDDAALDTVRTLFAQLAAIATWQQEIIAHHGVDAAQVAERATRGDLEALRDAAMAYATGDPEFRDLADDQLDKLQARLGDDAFRQLSGRVVAAGAGLGLTAMDNGFGGSR
jgi:uncharacterized protein CbrC (UPF0167 family)